MKARHGTEKGKVFSPKGKAMGRHPNVTHISKAIWLDMFPFNQFLLYYWHFYRMKKKIFSQFYREWVENPHVIKQAELSVQSTSFLHITIAIVDNNWLFSHIYHIKSLIMFGKEGSQLKKKKIKCLCLPYFNLCHQFSLTELFRLF